MKNLIYLLSLLLFSCNNENINPQSVNIDTGILIYLKDSNGNNLLNTEKYKEKEVKMFYLINNEVKEYYQSNLDSPRGFRFLVDDLPLRMALGPNTTETEEFPITYIKWNETDTDTIKCQFRRGSGNDGSFLICDKVWYNSKLAWDMANPSQNNEGRKVDVIK
jgi:hypothetical protein